MMRHALSRAVAGTFAFMLLTGVASAGIIEINTIDPSFTALQSWWASDIRDGGTASIVDLTGQGGDLENNAPLPTGAALLTTGASNSDKAEIAVADTWGTAGDLFSAFSLGYSYYKSSVGDLNAFAAPAIKLSFLGTHPTDGFVTLVYEPTWNQASNPGASVAVPTDSWVDVSITPDSGLFWGTGGFGQPNTAGGPPLRTLNEWAAAFDSQFLSADLVAVSVGVGTFNQGQTGYFDNVTIGTDSGSTTYDFEASAVVPEPSTFALLSMGTLGIFGYGWQVSRKKRRAAR